MAVEYLGTNGPDGTVLGQSSTEKIGFWGATPGAQGTFTNAAVSTSAAVSVCGAFAFTSAQANGIIALVNELRELAVTLGLRASS